MAYAPCAAPVDTVGCSGPSPKSVSSTSLGHYQLLWHCSVNICGFWVSRSLIVWFAIGLWEHQHLQYCIYLTKDFSLSLDKPSLTWHLDQTFINSPWHLFPHYLCHLVITMSTYLSPTSTLNLPSHLQPLVHLQLCSHPFHLDTWSISIWMDSGIDEPFTFLWLSSHPSIADGRAQQVAPWLDSELILTSSCHGGSTLLVVSPSLNAIVDQEASWSYPKCPCMHQLLVDAREATWDDKSPWYHPQLQTHLSSSPLGHITQECPIYDATLSNC